MNPLADKANDRAQLEALERVLEDTPASELPIIDAGFLTVEERPDKPAHFLRSKRQKRR